MRLEDKIEFVFDNCAKDNAMKIRDGINYFQLRQP